MQNLPRLFKSSLCKALALKSSQLGELFDLQPETVSRWEKGSVRIALAEQVGEGKPEKARKRGRKVA
jgi:hypothetical protein